MNKKVIIVTIALICLVVVTIVGTTLLRDEQRITIQGEVEVSETKISSKLPGRVENISVREGEMVEKGSLLFSIATPEIDAKLRQAQAARSAANAQKQKADAGARKQTIESARNLWEQAKAGATLAKKSFERITNLYNEGVIPEQKRDEVKAQYDVAMGNEKIAKAQYDMALEGAQKEDKLAANALVERADGAIQEVESYLADASQFAPYSGEVAKIIAENGELTSTGYPVITMIDITNPWIVFNIKESMLPMFEKGKKMSVYVPGLGHDIEIEIVNVSVQAEYATWTATRSRGTFDIRTFELRAYPTSKNTGLRPGMTVVYELENI